MKKIYAIAFLLILSLGYAQIPVGYYNSATGTGFTLKTQLYNKISSHTNVGYGGLWTLYYTSDAKANGKVWDIYSNCDFTFGTGTGGNQDNGSGGTSECQKYNREHTFPKSWFQDAAPMYSDAFHVMPTDKKVNSVRGNYAYGIVGTATYTSTNGTKFGNCVAPGYPYALPVMEPADEFKGDVARNYFYMATCYQNLIGSWQNNDADANTVLDGSNDNVFEPWFLNMLITWHNQDPVSAKEITRNNAIYNAQNNRNPYIDHPEYVCQIWATACAALSTPTLEYASISVYPNPSNDNKVNIDSNVAIDTIELVNINGQIVLNINKPVFNNNSYTLENLPQGFYFLRLSSENQSIIKKVFIN